MWREPQRSIGKAVCGGQGTECSMLGGWEAGAVVRGEAASES